MRIVSLLPSTTEIVAALGLKDQLVGRSHECDYPKGVDQLPAITSPKYPDDGNSRETDDRVKELLRRGLSVYEVDEIALRELKPDLIVTQDHCEVCAASMGDVRRALQNWMVDEPEVISVSPADLKGIFDSFKTIGEAVERIDEAQTLTEELEERFNILRQSVVGEPAKEVFTIEWIDPLMTAGNWIPELIEIAGGDQLMGEAGKHSPFIEWGDLIKSDPDVILVMPCGYSIEQTLSEMDTLKDGSGWNSLKAVKNNEVYILDGHHYFNRPGPRILDSTRIVAEVLHPHRFKPTFENRGWIRFQY
ncbi:MAG: cobalamin-binding protein [Balneolaceae bacterium]|nr:cobalamin-binding protein [Balneolaceae bacterium]MCH8549141.1 cobalamin-binding protein [Balneolaceae bacterium]